MDIQLTAAGEQELDTVFQFLKKAIENEELQFTDFKGRKFNISYSNLNDAKYRMKLIKEETE